MHPAQALVRLLRSKAYQRRFTLRSSTVALSRWGRRRGKRRGPGWPLCAYVAPSMSMGAVRRAFSLSIRGLLPALASPDPSCSLPAIALNLAELCVSAGLWILRRRLEVLGASWDRNQTGAWCHTSIASMRRCGWGRRCRRRSCERGTVHL